MNFQNFQKIWKIHAMSIIYVQNSWTRGIVSDMMSFAAIYAGKRAIVDVTFK